MSRRKKQKHTRKTLFDSIDYVNDELRKPSIGLKVLVGIVIVAAILIGTIWQKVQVMQLAQEIEQLEKEKQALEENIGDLNSRVLKLSDGKRIIKIAEKELGMIYPDSEILVLKQFFSKSEINEFDLKSNELVRVR